jgi:serine/threonine protein kinase
LEIREGIVKKTMRLLLVDNSQESLDSCVEKLGALSPEAVDELHLEAQLKGEDEFLATIHEYDAICFGPEMEGCLAATAHAASQTCPQVPIIALIGQEAFSGNKFEDNSAFRAIFSIESALGEIESELSGIIEDREAFVEEKAEYLFGRYKPIDEIGTGAVGTVYYCLDTELDDRPTAVKILSADLAEDENSVTRFKNEFYATSVLEHPNVIKPYQYHEDEDSIGVAMEYVDGKSLTSHLEGRDSTVTVAEALDILCQVCSGVHALHIADIVHRNIKPDNILLDINGAVKVTDSGIARSESATKLTQHGSVLGVLNYICPEYMLESKIDWRADIYAIGVLAYEMLTGQPPFPGDSIMEVMNQCLSTTPTPLAEFGIEGAEALNEVILKALARNPEERYQSAAQMYNDLQRLRGLDSSVFLEVPQRNPDESRRPEPASGAFRSPVSAAGAEQRGFGTQSPAHRSLQSAPMLGGGLGLELDSPIRTFIFFGAAISVGAIAAGIVLFVILPLFTG